MSLSAPWVDYDPRQVGLAAATFSIVTMLDTANSNRKRTFVKLTAADTGWFELLAPQFLVMTAFLGALDFDPVVTGRAGTVGDVWLGPSQGTLCYFEKAGTGDTEWARISEYSGGAPAVTGAAGTMVLTDQGWAVNPAGGTLVKGSRAPGSFTLANNEFAYVDGRLILTGAQRVTMTGDSRLILTEIR